MIERRKHRRIITLKNCAAFIVIALSLLAALNIASEMRAPKSNAYGRVEPVTQVAPKTPDVPVVTESDAPATTVIPSESEGPGWAGEPPQLAPPPPAQIPRDTRDDSGAKISIVGDSSGVSIVTPKHRLRGGLLPQ